MVADVVIAVATSNDHDGQGSDDDHEYKDDEEASREEVLEANMEELWFIEGDLQGEGGLWEAPGGHQVGHQHQARERGRAHIPREVGRQGFPPQGRGQGEERVGHGWYFRAHATSGGGPRSPRARRVSSTAAGPDQSQCRRRRRHGRRHQERPHPRLCLEPAFVEYPPEAGRPRGECRQLARWLYGMRGAARRWEEEFDTHVSKPGFSRGGGFPNVYHDPTKETCMATHGDDVTAVGRRSAVRELRAAMEDTWGVKVRAVLGPRLNDDKRITILGRGVTWKDEDAVEYIADIEHREAILQAFDLEEGSKGTVDMGLEPTGE